MKIVGIILFHLLLIPSYALQISGSSKNEKDKLLRKYDKYQPPPPSNLSGNADIKVTIRLISLFLAMDSEEEALTLTGYFAFEWTDKRLASTEDILYFRLDEIWSGVPSIAYIARSKILELGSGLLDNNYFIVFGGIVFGGSEISFRSVKACRSDLTNWPYDTKICNIHFISPATNGARVLYHTFNLIAMDGIANENSLECKGWDIEKLDFYAERNGSQIVLSLHLKRNGAIFHSYYYFSTVVTLLVSLSFFFLEPQSRERFVLLVLVTVIQFYFLLTLSLLAPHHYSHRPTIEYFIEMSSVLILIQIFLVIFCREMTQIEYNPSFLSKIVSMVVMSRVCKTLFLLDIEPKVANELIEEREEDGSFLIATTNQTKKQWQLICDLIHRATFYFAVLFSLYLVHIVI